MNDDDPVGVPGRQLFRFAAVFYLAMAVAGVLWIGSRQGLIGWQLFLRPERLLADLLLGLAAGLALAGLWEVARRHLALARALEARLGELLTGLDRTQVLALGIFSGLGEELFFRGAMQAAWGFLPATLLFAALHTGRGRDLRLWALFALAAGALFGALVLWRQTLLPACVAHFVVNTIGLERLARERRRSGTSDEPPEPSP